MTPPIITPRVRKIDETEFYDLGDHPPARLIRWLALVGIWITRVTGRWHQTRQVECKAG